MYICMYTALLCLTFWEPRTGMSDLIQSWAGRSMFTHRQLFVFHQKGVRATCNTHQYQLPSGKLT